MFINKNSYFSLKQKRNDFYFLLFQKIKIRFRGLTTLSVIIQNTSPQRLPEKDGLYKDTHLGEYKEPDLNDRKKPWLFLLILCFKIHEQNKLPKYSEPRLHIRFYVNSIILNTSRFRVNININQICAIISKYLFLFN